MLLTTTLRQRDFYFDASDAYFTTKNGAYAQDGDIETPLDVNNALIRDIYSLRSTTANVPMVSGAKFNPLLLPNQIHKATFRIKYQRSGSVPDTTPIAYIAVKIGGVLVASATLRDGSFSAQLTYQTFPLTFSSGSTVAYTRPELMHPKSGITLPTAAATEEWAQSFDCEVTWLGSGTIWLDDIRVDGARSGLKNYFNGSFADPDINYAFTENFFGGDYDNTILNRARVFINKSRLSRFYFYDEPWNSQFMSVRYTNNLLASIGASVTTGKGLGHQAVMECSEGGIAPYGRYSIEANPFEIATDPYRFHYNDLLPSESGYTDSTQLGNGSPFSGFQTQIDAFKQAQQNAANTMSGVWWFYPNVGLWAKTGQFYNREPTLSELSAQIFLSLCYGAKGICYFNFWTEDYNPAYNPNGSGVIGLINPDMTPITNSRYGENKWAGVKAINQKLAGALGTTLMKLHWQSGFSIHEGQPTGSYVSSVQIVESAETPIYVELGTFKNSTNDTDYFMIVNRRTAPGESRNIQTTFNNTVSWEITEIESGKIWIVESSGNFTDNLEAGQGKLYRVGPATWVGTKNIVNTVTVPSGATLDVSSGATLRFAANTGIAAYGVLNMSGTSSFPIILTTPSGTGSYGSWGSIILNGSGASGSHLNHIVMNYGTDISAYNVPSFTIENSTIANCVNGINSFATTYSYGNLQRNAIFDPQDHGIVAQLSSSVECGYNVIQKNSGPGYQSGAGIYLGAGGSSNFYHNQVSGFNWGVGTVTNSSADFTQPWPPAGLNNHITNCLEGLEIYNQSYINLDGMYAGYNGIHNNGVGAYLYYQSSADAKYNYWGDGTWSDVGYGCNLDNSEPLAEGCPYDYDYEFRKSGSVNGAESAVASQSSLPSNAKSGPTDFSLGVARQLKKDKQYGRAIEYLLSMGKAQKQIIPAMLELFTISEPSVQKDLFAAMQQLKSVAPVASRHLSGLLALRNGDIATAKANCREIISMYPNTTDARRANLLLFNIALFAENDLATAKSLLADVVAEKDASMDMEIAIAKQAYKNIESMGGLSSTKSSENKNLKKELSAQSEQAMPIEYALLQNYPNPFNPTTMLAFDLPEPSQVVLTVFDYIGREVATVVNGYRSAGHFEVTFDASKLGSGVYFYKLSAVPPARRDLVPTVGRNGQTGSYTAVKKMLLVK